MSKVRKSIGASFKDFRILISILAEENGVLIFWFFCIKTKEHLKFHYLSKIHDICNLIFLESLKQTLDFKQSTLDINYENF